MRPTQKLHQPPLLYENQEPPQMLTVREWFRKMRAADWAGMGGSERMDQLARTICEMHTIHAPTYLGNGFWTIEPDGWRRQYEARSRLVYDYLNVLFDYGIQGTTLTWRRPLNWKYLHGITE